MKLSPGIVEWKTIVKKAPSPEEIHKEDVSWIFMLLGWGEKNVKKRT